MNFHYILIFIALFLTTFVVSEEDDENPSVDKEDIACINGECEPGSAASAASAETKKEKGAGGQAAAIAQKAAQEAKAAEDAQQQAGQQAAKQVKTQLAEKAMEAAKAAEAALCGKEALVSQIQDELKEAEVVVSRIPIEL